MIAQVLFAVVEVVTSEKNCPLLTSTIIPKFNIFHEHSSLYEVVPGKKVDPYFVPYGVKRGQKPD